MDQFYHGRLPSPNDHRVFQAQAPHLLGNNCLSSPASPGTGSNLGIPHHGLEECEYTTHLVGEICSSVIPFTEVSCARDSHRFVSLLQPLPVVPIAL